MRKSILVVGILVLVIVSLGCVGEGQSQSSATTKTLATTQPPTTTQATTQTKTPCREVEVPYETEDEYLKTEYYSETVPYTETECSDTELVYRSTIENIGRNVVCSDSHEECVKKTLGVCTSTETVCDKYTETASFSITNLDTKAGTWGIKWWKACRSDQQFCTGPKTEIGSATVYLDPTETKPTSKSITYDAKAQEYLFSGFKSIPTKQVCKDVTKYKEVQKERQVTAFKTVTKYRTETVCE
ncbi:MAG: hypothetical protein V3U19_02240 [Thermodesulfobacteriota bacterium]